MRTTTEFTTVPSGRPFAFILGLVSEGCLIPDDLLIYVYLVQFSDESGFITVTETRIASDLSLRAEAVKESINVLIEHNLIAQAYKTFPGRSRTTIRAGYQVL